LKINGSLDRLQRSQPRIIHVIYY